MPFTAYCITCCTGYSYVFLVGLSFLYCAWLFTLLTLSSPMNLKGLIDLRDKPFGRVFPVGIQMYIMFWAACSETNDRRKEVNEQLLRIPVCLYTSIPSYVNFTRTTGYKPWRKTVYRFETRRHQHCHHCFRRNTQDVSVSVFTYFPSSFISCLPLRFFLFLVD